MVTPKSDRQRLPNDPIPTHIEQAGIVGQVFGDAGLQEQRVAVPPVGFGFHGRTDPTEANLARDFS